MASGSDATDLEPRSDTNARFDIFVRGVDAADPLAVDALLFADGALTEVVLEAVDATTGAVTTLCPADALPSPTARQPSATQRPRIEIAVPIRSFAGLGDERADPGWRHRERRRGAVQVLRAAAPGPELHDQVGDRSESLHRERGRQKK